MAIVQHCWMQAAFKNKRRRRTRTHARTYTNISFLLAERFPTWLLLYSEASEVCLYGEKKVFIQDVQRDSKMRKGECLYINNVHRLNVI